MRSGIHAKRRLAVSLALLAGAFCQSGVAADGEKEIVDHPKKLRFPPLDFQVPDAAKHRHVLESGVAVYVVEDDSLPLVDLSVLIRAGTYLDPAGVEGLAAAVGSQMRSGGTATHGPDEFDEEVDFLAAQISTSMGNTEGDASFNCLTKDLDRVLELFFDMLRNPRFDEERLELYRDQQLQNLERRNDSTRSIESREWGRLLRGKDHFSVVRKTGSSVKAISREKLLEFHKAHVHPGNFIVVVSGDVKKDDILSGLARHLEEWSRLSRPVAGSRPIPAPDHEPKSGVYIADKPDVNQGRLTAGHLAVKRDHPDYHSLLLMNHILGGGGFVSRITSRVRSDEGLAYTARSTYAFGTYYEGIFRAYFQSKSGSVAQALEIVLEEIERIRGEKVSEEELADAIQYYVGVFPRNFATAEQIALTFARDELTGRPADFWKTFIQKVKAVTTDQVLDAARKHLKSEDLIILIVGNAADILTGNPDAPRYSIEKIGASRGLHRIPLPDPVSLKYPETQ